MTGGHPPSRRGTARGTYRGERDGLDGLGRGTVPYPWPYDGDLDTSRLALVVAGANRWWIERCVDVAAIRPAANRAAVMVRQHGSHVVFLRHARTVGPRNGVDLGPGHPRRDVHHWDELAVRPEPTDTVVDTAGIDGFFGSSLDALLRGWGCTHLALAGFGLEGPVHSTLRSANDRGYECLVLTDACAASGEQTRRGALSTVTMSGGIFGAVGTVAHLAALLDTAHAADPEPLAPVEGTPTDMTRTLSSVAGSASGGRTLDVGVVDAEPYPWPWKGSIDPGHTAVLNVDWQHDFCGPGGYLDAMGYDIALTRAGLSSTATVLAAARSMGLQVLHTREGHRPDLSDCPPNKLWRSRRIGAGIGDPGPAGRILIRGEPGWEIVPEVAPLPGEQVIDKPGKGAFYATELDLVLRTAGVTHLVLTGLTTDVCVHTTMREANDRGYECLLLSDCTGATDLLNYEAALKMVTMQVCGFGSVATSAALLACLGVARIPGTPDPPLI